MGVTSANKARQALDLAFRVVAIELICSAQALDFRKPLVPGPQLVAAYDALRSVVPALEADRPPSPDIEALAAALRDGLLDALVPEAAV